MITHTQVKVTSDDGSKKMDWLSVQSKDEFDFTISTIFNGVEFKIYAYFAKDVRPFAERASRALWDIEAAILDPAENPGDKGRWTCFSDALPAPNRVFDFLRGGVVHQGDITLDLARANGRAFWLKGVDSFGISNDDLEDCFWRYP